MSYMMDNGFIGSPDKDEVIEHQEKLIEELVDERDKLQEQLETLKEAFKILRN